MSNEALDARIARNFMEWKQVDRHFYVNGKITKTESWWVDVDKNGDSENLKFHGDFKPTTDMRAAYLVLEKVASSIPVVILNSSYGGIRAWVIKAGFDSFKITNPELPLAISKLAEAIMDSPEYRGIFQGENDT